MTTGVPSSSDSAHLQQSVSTEAARLLAKTTNSAPQYIGSSPRWLVALLPWVTLKAGTFHINRLKVVAPPPHLVEVDVSGTAPTVSPVSLHAAPGLRALSDELLAAIADALVVERSGAGDSVTHAGDEPRFLIVAAGKMEATHDDPHGLTVRQALLGPGAQAPLRSAGAAAVRTREHRPRVARPVQHRG